MVTYYSGEPRVRRGPYDDPARLVLTHNSPLALCQRENDWRATRQKHDEWATAGLVPVGPCRIRYRPQWRRSYPHSIRTGVWRGLAHGASWRRSAPVVSPPGRAQRRTRAGQVTGSAPVMSPPGQALRDVKLGKGGWNARSITETSRWNPAGNQSRPVELAGSRKRVLRGPRVTGGCEA